MSDASRDDLIEETRESYETAREEQDHALEQIARGGDLEKYTEVELGELELKVKAWLPGESVSKIQSAESAMNADGMDDISEHIETIIEVLSDMTEDGVYDEYFWSQYYNVYGPSGILIATEAIITPAVERLESSGDSLGNSPGPGEEKPSH